MTSDLPQDSGHAHVRWWIVGPVTGQPTGRARVLTRDDFSAQFSELAGGIKVDVTDALGADKPVRIEHRPDKLRGFALREIVASVPTLNSLRELADAFGGPASKRPDVATALSSVEALVGRGPLYTELQACFDLGSSSASTDLSASNTASTATALDAALEASRPSTQRDAKTAVDSFVSTMRQNTGSGSVSASTSAGHRKARDVLERRIYAAAGAVLATPEARRLEGLWRGLKLVVDECQPGSISIRLVDVSADGIVDALRSIPSSVDDPMDGPDAVFVLGDIDDADTLTALANVGADLDAPVVVNGSASLWGAKSVTELAATADDGGLEAATAGAWQTLRTQDVARWLCVVTNRIVAQAEGTGTLRRIVFADASLAFAAMLSASFCYTGGFARILGRTGGLKAPSLWDAPAGSSTVSIPTEAFVPVRAQTVFARAGIVALGSARNSDTVLTSAMPTVCGANDAFPFAAQLLTGRLVRFSRWVIDQVPAGCSASDLSQLFSDAATVFLFPGMPENAARLEAEAVDGGRSVRLIATVRPELAGIPFEVGFDMPLKTPVST